jgi:hypothetical protein
VCAHRCRWHRKPERRRERAGECRLANNYNTTGTTATLPKTFTARTGGQAFGASAWPGHNVKFTMTLSPSGTDSLSSDNMASVTLKFPANQPTADLLTPVPCS